MNADRLAVPVPAHIPTEVHVGSQLTQAMKWCLWVLEWKQRDLAGKFSITEPSVRRAMRLGQASKGVQLAFVAMCHSQFGVDVSTTDVAKLALAKHKPEGKDEAWRVLAEKLRAGALKKLNAEEAKA